MEVPYTSDIVPGDNVFIAPNPVKIEKGSKLCIVKIILLTDRVKNGFEGKLLVKLNTGEVNLKTESQFTVDISKK